MALFFRPLAFSALFLAGAISLVSCGSDEANQDNVTADSIPATPEGQSAKNVFYSIPSPIELATLVKKAGAQYDPKMLNDPENISKYNTSGKQALNLGVYGTDLSMTTIFDRTQESIFYLKSARRLADALGITGAFSDETISSMESNQGNHDSLLSIITDSYFATDEYLKENQRPGVSALIMAGGWIEGLYLGTQLAKSTKNNAEIVKRIADLKGSLDNLVMLLSIYQDDAEVAKILADLNALKNVYDGMTAGGGATSVSTDQSTKVTTIGGGATYTLSPEQLEKITKMAEEMRTKVVSI
ncbi:MAG: hypothetical protein IT233_00190 [Bacteroidia bacterium]|nr:hypothetical protein [Bacteroidia bacterium]